MEKLFQNKETGKFRLLYRLLFYNIVASRNSAQLDSISINSVTQGQLSIQTMGQITAFIHKEKVGATHSALGSNFASNMCPLGYSGSLKHILKTVLLSKGSNPSRGDSSNLMNDNRKVLKP